MGTKNTYCFELKNNMSELSTLCEKLEGIGDTLGLPRKTLFEVNLALDELFTNILSYGFTDRSEHIIRVRLATARKTLTVTIEDDGIPFNPVDRRAPRLPRQVEDCRVGGLGIHLVKKIMDEVSYRRYRGKNILTMKKAIDNA